VKAGYNQAGRVEMLTGGAAPVAGKVIIALAVRSSRPLRKVIRATHGPAGICVSRAMLTSSVSPMAKVVPKVAANGPALSPPGPDERSRVPLMSSARPPVLCTAARTTGWPSDERSAVSESIVKSAAGAPPGPTER
jgi:hypothetical protein